LIVIRIIVSFVEHKTWVHTFCGLWNLKNSSIFSGLLFLVQI
jgi:hypothetical protein